MATYFEWSTLKFGKHEGQSLPHVILTDPDWFYWAYGSGIFREPLDEQAAELASRASVIKPPKDDWQNWRVHYQLSPDYRFLDFSLIRAESAANLPPGSTLSNHLDLSLPRQLRNRGHQVRSDLMLKKLRHYYFGGSQPSRWDCEQFFYDHAKFLTA